MKNVLIIGGAGTIGRSVVRFLLSEGKYDITVLDIKGRKTYRRLKKYQKRIRIVYADMNDKSVIDNLVKENLYIIYLGGNLPPFANINEDLMNNNEYNAVKVLVDSIKRFNPSCHLFYGSSTSVYDKEMVINSDTKISSDKEDYYAVYKIKCEKYIIKNLKNYTILRIPYVLSDIARDNMIYNVSYGDNINSIYVDDLAFSIVSCLSNRKALNKKVFLVNGGENYNIYYGDLVLKVLDTYGLTWKLFKSFFTSDRSYVSPVINDDKLNDLLNYRGMGINRYYNMLEDYRTSAKRFIPRLLAKPFKLLVNKKK